LRIIACAVALTLPIWQLFAQSSRLEYLRGRVVNDSGMNIANATVIVTRFPDQTIFRQYSDARGAFEFVIHGGTGNYLVFVSSDSSASLGAYRSRILRTSSDDSVFVIRAVLPYTAARTLQAVKVTAERLVPEQARNVLEAGPGAVERAVLGVSAITMPEQRGDLAALAASVPGIALTPAGVSALGVGGQNNTTLDGLAFPGASVPRDMRFTTRVSTSTFDPARGWFGGAETSVQIEPGLMLRSMRASGTFDARGVQGGDQLAGRLGQQFASAVASIGGDGYAVADRVAYSFGLEASHRTANIVRPIRLDGEVLSRVGLSRDSAARAALALSSLGVPLSPVRGSGDGLTTSTFSLLTRLNTPEFDSRSNTRAKHSLGLTAYAFRQERDGIGASPLAMPTRDGAQASSIFSAQAMYSTLQSKRIVQTVRSAISVARESTVPLVDLPSGDVLIVSELSDSSLTNTSLKFGGGTAQTSTRRLTWETQSKTALYLGGNPRHLVEMTADVRFDRLVQHDASNLLGTFNFANLDALAQNVPLSFTRTLTAAPQRGAVWNGFLAASDAWKPSSRLRILFGLRAEANAFAERPARNTSVYDAFGVSNDVAPNRVTLSPRLGFQWRYSDAPATSGYFSTGLGVLPYFATGIVRGGVGRFTGFMSPATVGIPASATGLPNANLQLSCFGSAAPVPTWQAFEASQAAIPTSCLPTSGQTSLVDAAPSVRLLERGYSVPDSWRANLGWAARNSWLSWSIDATFAWNRHQASELDLNFSDRPSFRTSDEGRPVFVPTSGVVSSTGAVSPAEARRVKSFASVVQSRSDLSGRAKQLIVTAVPNMRSLTGTAYVSVSYTVGSARGEQRGFDISTFDSPLGVEWQRSSVDIRHTVIGQLGLLNRLVSVTLFGRFTSGQPFTPIVQSDVNGDGRVNDRAFVFNPSEVADSELSSGMRDVLVRAPRYARECLVDQIGRAVRANSCSGPWTATLNARIASKKLAWRDAEISLSFFNLPGLVDRLVHGGATKGWGNLAAPDPVLLQPYGFDSGARRFLYRVNARFGESWSTVAISPFRVNLDVRLSLAPSASRQLMRRLLRSGSEGRGGIRMDAQALVSRLRRSGPQPYRDMLELADSLQLGADQIKAITKADEDLRSVTDSVWQSLAEWMVRLPERYDEATVLSRQELTTEEVWEMSRKDVQTTLRLLLTPQQLSLLPFPASLLFTSTKPIKGMRVFDYRDP
jgi:hypothetical protein